MTVITGNHPRLIVPWEAVVLGGQVAAYTVATLRRAMVAIASAFVGYSYASKPAAYKALLYPYDGLAVADALAKVQSGCGLTCAGWLELWGNEDPELKRPYHGRNDIMGTLTKIGRRHGAYVTPDGNLLPAQGDIFLLGQNNGGPSWGRGVGSQYEHFLCVRDHDGKVMDSIDGGQPGIEERTRTLVYVGTELWCGDTRYGLSADGRPIRGRRAQGWLSLSEMPVPAATMLPPGTDLGTL